MENKKNQKSQKKPPSKIDPLSFEDVPGLGPTKIAVLKKEGWTTTQEIICKTPMFLKEITGMDMIQAGEAFAYMKKKLTKAGIIGLQEMNAMELLRERQKIQRVSMGCKSLDRLLNGGVECKSITEFYGEKGSGKTQISHTLAIQVQRPIEEGGLKEPGKPPPIVLYIDTEGTCRPERFITILSGKKLISDYPEALKQKILDDKIFSPEERKLWDDTKKKLEKEAEKYLNNIQIQKATSTYQQFSLVRNAVQSMQHMNVKLIILDSGTALFRREFLERGVSKARSNLLNDMLGDLKLLALHYNIPIIFINQIYHKPDVSYGKDDVYAYGGNIVAHTVPYSIKLEKFIKTNKATIMKSPYQANDEARFVVTYGGLSDVKK